MNFNDVMKCKIFSIQLISLNFENFYSIKIIFADFPFSISII